MRPPQWSQACQACAHFTATQLRHGNGSVAVDVGKEAVGRQVADGLWLMLLAETLDDPMTNVILPRVNFYRSLDDVTILHAGVSPGLLRVSVGLERAADVVADMFHAMQLAGE